VIGVIGAYFWPIAATLAAGPGILSCAKPSAVVPPGRVAQLPGVAVFGSGVGAPFNLADFALISVQRVLNAQTADASSVDHPQRGYEQNRKQRKADHASDKRRPHKQTIRR
jgi:hypothetical protein